MTALSTVTVKITGDTGQLVSSLTVAEKRVTAFSSKIATIGRAEAQGLSTLGRGFLTAAGQTGVLNSEISILASSVGGVGLSAAAAGVGFGALVGGIGASIASAVSFETAITRVAKTANLSAEETAAFGDAILDMSRRLPVAISDLARIAEVAGQLGISGTSNIASFVEEIAKLQSTTGVSADVLATSLGTLTQVLNVPVDQIGRVSAAITELGNTSNSTETQILDISTRLAGVGSALNIPIAAILGISSAVAAATGDVEASATAVQETFLAIDAAATVGGASLTQFASLAGLTTDEFAALAKAHPEQAFTKFVEGLKDVSDAPQILDDLGLAGVRTLKTLLALANLGAPLGASIDTGTRAALNGTATNVEFARSADTTAAKFQLLKNNIHATSVEIGEVFVPAVVLALDALNGLFAGGFGADDAIKDFFGGLADKVGEGRDAFVDRLNEGLGRDSAIKPNFRTFGFLGQSPRRDTTTPSAPADGPSFASRILGVVAGLENLRPPRPGRTGGGDDGGGGSSGGGSAPHQLTALEAAMDGIITRTEALTLGLTDQEAVALELAVASNTVADEEYRRRIGLLALATAYPGLTGQEVQFRIGLEAIAEHLALTGESIEKFILDTSTSALEGFQSAFDAIFNKPTKEDAELQLQLDLAKRKKLLAPGASEAQTKAFDADIKRIQDLIDVRNNTNDVLKDIATIADATLDTDQSKLTQTQLYTVAIADASTKTRDNTGIVYLQTLAQMGLTGRVLEATTAIASLGDAAANSAAKMGLSLPDALRALAGLPDHGASLLPSLDSGGVVTRSGIAQVDKGERFYNNGSGPRGESGVTNMNFTTYFSADSEASEASMRKQAKMLMEEQEAMLRRAGFRGSYVTSGAYTPS